jgi:putative FmdB family regulatory protein
VSASQEEPDVPTYQYACTACGEELEAVQSFSDPSLTECPACGGQLRKVFSAVGVVFKGSGFYKTDSRSSSSAGDASKPEKKSETKTESSAPAAPASTSTPAASTA